MAGSALLIRQGPSGLAICGQGGLSTDDLSRLLDVFQSLNICLRKIELLGNEPACSGWFRLSFDTLPPERLTALKERLKEVCPVESA